MKRFQDAGHLFRLAAVFLVGVLAFLGLRGLLVPRSFGQYGHYRGDAIKEIAALPVSYAGHQVCEGCHTEVLDVKSKGMHKGVACESCHGPQAKHADDPAAVQPAKLDTAVLCVRCHAANSSRPKNFPQVGAAEHSGGEACNTCHQPHSPAMVAGGSQ
ncbi:MAG: multiheme c-type cytochrome [Acidobacteriota bacterium]|nr:multiheme c-type cytochrome [Acidobacteriota bacterium]